MTPLSGQSRTRHRGRQRHRAGLCRPSRSRRRHGRARRPQRRQARRRRSRPRGCRGRRHTVVCDVTDEAQVQAACALAADVRSVHDGGRQRRLRLRSPAAPHHARRLELRDGHQPHRRVPHHQALGRAPRPQRRRRHRGHLVDRGAADAPLHDAVLRQQGRARDAGAAGRRRARLGRHPGERGAPRAWCPPTSRSGSPAAPTSWPTTSTRCRSAAWARSTTSPNAVRFLLGDESSWITGQCISADGGHTCVAAPTSPH